MRKPSKTEIQAIDRLTNAVLKLGYWIENIREDVMDDLLIDTKDKP